MQTTNTAERYDLLVTQRVCPDSVRAAWIDTGIAILCILPLLLTIHIPLDDLPDHLARQYPA